MTRVPLRLVIVGTVVSIAADAWFATVAAIDRVLACAPWKWEYQHGPDGDIEHRRTP